MNAPLKSILIAEDHSAVSRFLEVALRRRGYDIVGVAPDGQKAVELVRSLLPNLILLDFHMPILDGLEAAKQIIALDTTAVVLITADPDPAVARTALDLGVSGYMKKPLEIQQTVLMIENAWHRFQTIRGLREETRKLNETLETRKLFEKAKGILMEQQGFTENEAHGTIQKMAQDQGITVKELCRSLIQVRMVLGGKPKPALRSKDAA
jgi:AmiR/NasT family two-component response regulator